MKWRTLAELRVATIRAVCENKCDKYNTCKETNTCEPWIKKRDELMKPTLLGKSHTGSLTDYLDGTENETS